MENLVRLMQIECNCMQNRSKEKAKMYVVSLNQGIVRSVGCGLLAPLANEMIKKEKSLGHCELAMTHLTMVGNQP